MRNDDFISRDLDLKLVFSDQQPDERTPRVALIARDAKNNVIAVAKVGDDDRVRIDADSLRDAVTFALIPEDADPSELDGVETVSYHRFQLDALSAGSATLEIGRGQWLSFLPFRRCVSGTVEHCRFWPWLVQLNNQRVVQSSNAIRQFTPRLSNVPSFQAELAADLSQIQPVFPWWLACKAVCDGIIEVYQRRCCCVPIIIHDPRIPEIVRRLADVVQGLPPIGPLPPDPDPTIDGFVETPFMVDGSVDTLAVNAEADLHALRTLPAAAVVDYLQVRPHRWCFCTTPTKVAQGFIQPDGTFNICWTQPLVLTLINCHYEYSFVVKQLIDDATVTIYNGVAANQWFRLGDDINLVSYHPGAIVCDPGGVIGTASVILDAIGTTPSTNLQTPLQTGRTNVIAPSGEDGLEDPAAPLPLPLPPALPPVQYNNYGWGGTLAHRYLFGPSLEPICPVLSGQLG
jgi:hypothetical protein